MNKIKATLEKALIESGRILARAFDQPKEITYKGFANLVTKTDTASESAIIGIIRKNFPKHAILAEESAASTLKHKDGILTNEFEGRAPMPYKWIIDPVDGTTNFAHGLPIACVSIGLEMDGVVTLGGVWNPFSKELFWAEKGKGAYLNGKRIHVSKISSLEKSLLVTGFPYDRTKYAHRYLKIVEVFMKQTHGIRRLGSAALDLCFVAAGRFDGYWETKLNPWDQAAGGLMVQEAGGRTSNFLGRPFDIYEKQTLATNGKIHSQMLRVLSNFAAIGVKR